MNTQKRNRFKKQLEALAESTDGVVRGLEEGARASTTGEAAGNLSKTPMHLGDLGTEMYHQELNATLLEYETQTQGEILDALKRLDEGVYGQCESCNVAIPEKRLEALPYARHCVACAERFQKGQPANFNANRPSARGATLVPADTNPRDDVHAAGTAGGGTAVGGLAGTNMGRGNPGGADLEAALGSGMYDNELESDDGHEGYAGPSGGAVGGAPTGKRARGGRGKKS